MSTSTPPRQRAPQQRQPSGSGAGKATAADEAAETGGPKLDKKKKIILGVLVVVIAAAAYYFLAMKPAPAEVAEPAPEPGEVLVLDAISVNLEGSHYLRIGVALQMVAAGEGGGHGAGSAEPDGSMATDLVIGTFSGRGVDELSNLKEREKVKEELKEKIMHAYHDEVMDIYFTDFVTQ